MLQNIPCNTLKFATFISLNHFMGEFSYIRRYLLPGDGGGEGVTLVLVRIGVYFYKFENSSESALRGLIMA